MIGQRRINQASRATTLVELVVASAMMVVVMAVIFPIIAAARKTFDVQCDTFDALQNGRILMGKLTQDLTTAKSIVAVSEADEGIGYIEFKDNTETTRRFDINSANNYVQYGPIGDLHDLAGPVSQLQFTCYDVCDLDTPTANIDEIRYVKIQATVGSGTSGGGARLLFPRRSPFADRPPGRNHTRFSGLVVSR